MSAWIGVSHFSSAAVPDLLNRYPHPLPAPDVQHCAPPYERASQQALPGGQGERRSLAAQLLACGHPQPP